MRVKSGLKIVVLGFSAIALATCGASTPKTVAPSNPTAKPAAAPFKETVFGVKISDPYRGMEDPTKLKEMVAWITSASDQSKAQLAALPGRAKLAASMPAASRAGTNYSDAQTAGGQIFAQRLDPDASMAKLVVREVNGQERVLLDPAKESGGNPESINNYAPSH
jgi:prolyl oligopeptidase